MIELRHQFYLSTCLPARGWPQAEMIITHPDDKKNAKHPSRGNSTNQGSPTFHVTCKSASYSKLVPLLSLLFKFGVIQLFL